MDILIKSCAGFDVHKKNVMVCVRLVTKGGQVKKKVRSFGTVTSQLHELRGWLAELGVTHVAMESTGVFWKPLYNVLEDQFEVLLCNAKHIKQVPGRKTDVKDCEWIAQLLQHGLLKASFVPPRPLRQLRELTRHRAQLANEKNRVANRIQKTLQDANIKLSSVATDILGKSGRLILEAIIKEQAGPEELAELAQGRLRSKRPQLELALEGYVTEHHRYMLRMLMGHLSHLEAMIEQLGQRIAQLMKHSDTEPGQQAPPDDEQASCGEKHPPAKTTIHQPVSLQQAVELLDTIPGINLKAAQNVVAQIGTNMDQFATSAHLNSWSGLCPGNKKSAGKSQSGRTTKGNRWLRRTLTQAAWAASRKKDSYLSSLYRRLVSRKGKKRALLAVAHSILTSIYHMLKNHIPYQDLGTQHFNRLDPQRLTRYLVRRLESLGHCVTLEPNLQTT